jgi:hypothetical protein
MAIIQKIRNERAFIDLPFDPSRPYDAPRRFLSPVLLKVVAALLHFFWKTDTGSTLRFVKAATEVKIQIFAIPVSFVSLRFILTTSNSESDSDLEIFQLYNEIRMNQTSAWICKLSSLHELTRAEATDMIAIGAELDIIAAENGVEFNALRLELQTLMSYY